MEKVNLNRHDFVFITEAARLRLAKELMPNYSTQVQPIVSSAFTAFNIPGIVRRSEAFDENLLPLGFVPLERYLDQRVRVGCFVEWFEVAGIVTPQEVLKKNISSRTKALELAQEIAAWNRDKGYDIGIIGSVGLEILTGYPYTNADSDIDLVLGPHPLDLIKKIYSEIEALAHEKSVGIDLEIMLPNGFGVKAKELFMNTSTLLGKSLTTVDLLERSSINKYFI